MSSSNNVPDPELLDMIETLTDMIAAGSLSKAEALLAECPQHEPQLRELLPALNGLAHLAVTGSRRDGETEPQVVCATGEIETYPTVGDFRLVRELGRGGMGIVYEAEQISLSRRVALKVLPFGSLSGQTQLKRFRNEAFAAAQLDHPNIVDVLGIGSDRDQHFIAMRLVSGENLARVLAVSPGMANDSAGESPSRDSPVKHSTTTAARPAAFAERERWVAEIGQQVAAALEHAHARGVIHRDIKPSNLILEADGKVWVTDFGLARTEADPTLTTTGYLVGTLRYMSPEQALGNRLGVDHRADIYALGATLYELLAGEPMLSETEQHELLRRILGTEPAPLRTRQPLVSRDMETIVMKAVASDRDDRYQTVAELRADLISSLNHRPIQARHPTCTDRLRKWCHRHRRAVLLSGVISGFVLLIVCASAFVAWHERSQRVVAQQLHRQQLAVIEEQQETMRNHRYVAGIQLAYQCWRGIDGTGMRKHLVDCLPADGETDLRDFAWHYLWQLLEGTPAPFGQHDGEAYFIAQSPDESILATCGSDGIRLWDTTLWQPLRHLQQHTADVNFVEFTPDGKRLVSASDDGTVKIWSTESWDLLDSVRAADWVVAAHLLPDHRRLLVAERRDRHAARSSQIRMFDLSTRKVVWEVKQPVGLIQAIAAVPDASKAFVVNAAGTLTLLDVNSGKIMDVRKLDGGEPKAVAVDATGRFVAAAGTQINVWRLSALPEPPLFESGKLEGGVESLSFITDGRIVSSHRDGSAIIWNLNWEAGEPELQISRRFTHDQALWCARVTQDSRWLVTTDRSGRIVRWPLDERCSGEPERIRLGKLEEIPPDAKRRFLACSYRDDVTPDGSTGWFLMPDNRIQTWDLLRDQPIEPNLMESFDAEVGSLDMIRLSPNGKIVGVSTNHHLRFFERMTSQWDSGEASRSRLAWGMVWARDNRHVAAVYGHGKGIEIIDTITGEGRIVAPGILAVAWTRNDESLVTLNSDGTVSLWNAESWREIDRFAAESGGVHSAAVSRESRTLATTDGKSVQLWNLATRRPYFTLPVTRGLPGNPLLRFSQDGTHLGAVGRRDGAREILIWTTDSER